jgi:hypothetical protein
MRRRAAYSIFIALVVSPLLLIGCGNSENKNGTGGSGGGTGGAGGTAKLDGGGTGGGTGGAKIDGNSVDVAVGVDSKVTPDASVSIDLLPVVIDAGVADAPIGQDAPITLDTAQIDSGAKATGDGGLACVEGEVGSVAAGLSFYNTGVDRNNQQLSGGSLDPHYQMRQVSGGAYTGNSNWTSAVAMDTSITWSQWNTPSDARWIYVADAANLGQDWGTYEFMTTFDLTGYDSTTAVLAGKWALDQYGTIYLNGNLVATLPDQNWNNNLTSFNLTSGFLPGTNTLTFSVRFPDGGDGMIVSGASLSASLLPKCP